MAEKKGRTYGVSGMDKDPELEALVVEAHDVLGQEVLTAAVATAMGASQGAAEGAMRQEHEAHGNDTDAGSLARVHAAQQTRFHTVLKSELRRLLTKH